MSDHVRAKKGNQETTFSKVCWDLLGKNKEGWKLVKEIPEDVKKKLVKTDSKNADGNDNPETETNTDGTEGTDEGKSLKDQVRAKIDLAVELEKKNELNEAVSLLNEAKAMTSKNNPFLNGILSRITTKLKSDGTSKAE